jgi:iron complex transport system substrate-binding protein
VAYFQRNARPHLGGSGAETVPLPPLGTRLKSMQRIVSLLPSSTEIVCALGCGERLVGRSHECDYPEHVRSLPVCTEAKFDPDGTSYQIDQRVKAILQEAVSVYRVDADLLDQLAPDLLVTQSQCEVCAVSLKDVEEAARAFVHSKPEILSLAPNELEDVWRDIERAAQVLGVQERGTELTQSLRRRLRELRARTSEKKQRPRIACIEWFSPLMAAGNWSNWRVAPIYSAEQVSIRRGWNGINCRKQTLTVLR